MKMLFPYKASEVAEVKAAVNDVLRETDLAALELIRAFHEADDWRRPPIRRQVLDVLWRERS